MPPRAKRPRLPTRPPGPPAAAAAADPGSSRGWLSLRRGPANPPRQPANPPRQPEDAGTPLNDEVLLLIFAGLPDLADLVRCVATCRRWRRLVSGEAAFLCRAPKRSGGKFARPLALGFFHHPDQDQADAAAPPRFVRTPSASHLLGLQQPPSLNTLVQGLDGAEGLFDSSRIVASRNGLLVVDLRHGKNDRTLKLCVCNPMTGAVHVLPPLSDKDGLGHYACTVLTADDLDDKNTDPARSSYFRLIMLYTRRGFTLFRSYSSDEGSWGEEAKVAHARLGKKQLGLTRMGVVDRGGKLVYWLAAYVVFVLSLNSMASKVVRFPISGNGWHFDMANTLLGFSPEGNHCAIQFGPPSKTKAKRNVTILVFTSSGRPGILYNTKKSIPVDQFLPADVIQVKLRWFCEKSGVVFFTAVCGSPGDRRREVYALSLGTRMVEMVASHTGEGDPWKNLHGYEMDQAAYLASLAERDVMEDA